MIPRLALLQALKHYKRSLVVLGAATVAVTVMITVGSLLNGITASFYDTVIPNSGHVRIQAAEMKGALNPFSLDLLVPGVEAKLEAIAGLKDPRIVDAEALTTFGAVVEADTGAPEPKNVVMRGVAVDPGTRFADNVRLAMTGGSFLPGGEGIAISEAVSRLIGAGLGEKAYVLVQDRSGAPWPESLSITGVFKTESKDFDESTFYISRAKADEMLDIAGDGREIRLLLADREQAESVTREVAALFANEAGPRIESWQSINAAIFAILLFVKIILGFVMCLFAVVAATIIANTSLVSVMERLREFGTMRAIGLKGRQLEAMVMIEGAFLAAAGAALGLVLGAAAVALLSAQGVDLGGLMGSLGLSRFNKPRNELWWYAFCAGTGLLVGLAATAKAARTVRAMGVAESLATAD